MVSRETPLQGETIAEDAKGTKSREGQNWSASDDQDKRRVEKAPALLRLADRLSHLMLKAWLPHYPWASWSHRLCQLLTTASPDTDKQMSTLTGDSHYFFYFFIFFWWMGTWISEKIEELFQKHEEMWKHAKGGNQELWLAKLFVTRKCDHPYDKWPGMKGPVLVIIPGTICILQPCPEVSQLAT